MAEQRERSAFLPLMLLVGGILACFGLVLYLVPLAECDVCSGLGNVTWGELNSLSPSEITVSSRGNMNDDDLIWGCDRCEREGKITVFQTGFPLRFDVVQVLKRRQLPDDMARMIRRARNTSQ